MEESEQTVLAAGLWHLSLRFGPDGRVDGFAGCNTFRGQYSVQDDTLSIGPLATTRRACTSPALQTQEQAYLNDLQTTRTFRVGGGLLTLVTSAGRSVQLARPVP